MTEEYFVAAQAASHCRETFILGKKSRLDLRTVALASGAASATASLLLPLGDDD